MAELPHIGRHCELSACNRLDFTPFRCRQCERYHCSDHRFSHGCSSSRTFDPTTCPSAANPLTPYLCSFEGCPKAESIKVVCPHCSLNFCLQHRHDVDHSCIHAPEVKRRQQMQENIAATREAVLGTATATTSQFTAPKDVQNSTESRVPKLSEADQRKADRVAVMKLKMNNKSGLDPQQQMVVFVEWDTYRQPVILGKSWTIGRSLDAIFKSIEKSTSKAVGTSKLKMCSKLSGAEFDASATTEHSLKDMDTVVLKSA